MPGILQELEKKNIERSREHTVAALDEGIAVALAMCPEGQVVEVHDADCEVVTNGFCTCVPLVLKPGALA